MLNKKGVITMLKIKCTVEFRDKEASTYRSVGDEFVVEEKIDKLEQPYKTVLYLRFIRGIKLKDMKNGYTERQCLRIQKRRNKFIRKFIKMSVKGI